MQKGGNYTMFPFYHLFQPSSSPLFHSFVPFCPWSISAQLLMLIFPTALEGSTSIALLAERRSTHTYTHTPGAPLHTHIHSRTHAHIWCEVWNSVAVLYNHSVTSRVAFLIQRGIFIMTFFSFSKCWRMRLRTDRQREKKKWLIIIF